MRRVWIRGVVSVGVALWGSLPASAGFFQQVYRGLGVVATPSGNPSFATADGGRTNGNRFGRLRIVPNQLGNGYRLELDRTFGVDTRGRAETFDAGPLELTLSGTTQTTLGFTRRGGFIGNADTTINSLNYKARVTPVLGGGTEATVTGVLDVSNALEINALGFYTLDVNVRNSQASVSFDTLNGGDNKPINFDVGPINVRGNIFLDALIGVLNAAGVDTTQLAQFSGRSAIDQFNEAVRQAFAEQGLVLGAQVSLTGADATTTAKPFAAVDLSAAQVSPPAPTSPVTAPEPAALLLMVCGLLLWRRR